MKKIVARTSVTSKSLDTRIEKICQHYFPFGPLIAQNWPESAQFILYVGPIKELNMQATTEVPV